MVVCEEAVLAENGYVLSYPGTEFATNMVTVFAELFQLRMGSVLRAYLVGPDGERADVSSEELVPQNARYLQCTFGLGNSDLPAGPYRVQVSVDNMILVEKDILLGADI